MTISKYKGFWAVYTTDGELLAVTVYKKGAQAIVALFEKVTR